MTATHRQPAASLVISGGPGAGQSFAITEPATIIGRHRSCDIQVDDPGVSRQHASITWSGTDYVIEDLNSANGTFVNGERISGPHPLKGGDVIGLGQVELAFQAAVPVLSEEMPTLADVVAPPAGKPAPPPARVSPPPDLRPEVRTGEPATAEGRGFPWVAVVVGVLVLLCLCLALAGGGYWFWQRGQQGALVLPTLPGATTSLPTQPVIPPGTTPSPAASRVIPPSPSAGVPARVSPSPSASVPARVSPSPSAGVPAGASPSPPTGISGARRAFPDTSDGIFVFNDQLSNLSDVWSRFAATHYVGAQKMTRSEARAVRQYNPNFIILHYRLGLGLGYRVAGGDCQPTGDYIGIFAGDDGVQEWPADGGQDTWFYKYNGERVYMCDWGWYVMNLDDPGWREHWSEEVMRQIAGNEDDGVFADSYSVPNYLGADRYRPNLPELDENFEKAWAASIEGFTAYIVNRFAGRYYFIPNVGSWTTTRDPTDYSGVDGVMIEGFASWGPGSPFEPVDWELQMNRILGLTAQDKAVIMQSYVDPANVEERLFTLASYLLVKGKHSYINLEVSSDAMEPEWFPEYEIPLGAYSASAPLTIGELRVQVAEGIYARRYASGMVVVNPTGEARSLVLAGTYYRARPSGGGAVPEDGDVSAWRVEYEPVTRLDLPPYSGAILLAEKSPTAEVTTHDPNLVAVWREARQIGEGGQSSEPGDPLLIGFFDDGTFKAVFEGHRAETYHDFWGEWRTEGDSLALTITGGNKLPRQSTYRGQYEVREKELVLHGIALVDDFAGPTTVFSYERPAPAGKVA
jgi:hypothetical protein